MSVTTEEETASAPRQPAPPPVPAMADAVAAAAAIRVPGVSPKSISPAAEANKDVDHLMGVGGDRAAAEARAADDMARTGTITGLTGGQKAGDVVQASQQAATNAQLQVANAPPAAMPQAATVSMGSLKGAVADAISGLKDGAKQEMAATAQHIAEASLGTRTPPPAAVVSQPAQEAQMARA